MKSFNFTPFEQKASLDDGVEYEVVKRRLYGKNFFSYRKFTF